MEYRIPGARVPGPGGERVREGGEAALRRGHPVVEDDTSGLLVDGAQDDTAKRADPTTWKMPGPSIT